VDANNTVIYRLG